MAWQVAIQATDRMIIALGTDAGYTFPAGTDFGAEYPIVTIEDDAEAQVYFLPTDPAYLSPDPPPYHVLAEAPV